MRRFRRLFRGVKDPRASNARHDLVEILFIALAATLAGAKSCIEFEAFGLGRAAALGEILELPHGIPSHDTFSNVFRALEPEALVAVLRKFTKGFSAKGVVALDGKALRGAYARGKQAVPLHMVNLWAAETRLALAQRKAPNRNEAKGALELLASLDLKGAIVTADALHCRPDTAALIRARKGHYVLALKQNRGLLFKAADALVTAVRKPSRAAEPAARAHGRRSGARPWSYPPQALARPTASPISSPSAASTAGAAPMARRPSPSAASSYSPASSRPSSCSRPSARTGASRTTFTGCSMSCSPRTPAAAARITPRRTSPHSESSPSTSCRQPQDQSASATKCSAQDGTTTSCSMLSPICDSPTRQGEVGGRLRPQLPVRPLCATSRRNLTTSRSDRNQGIAALLLVGFWSDEGKMSPRRRSQKRSQSTICSAGIGLARK